MPVKRARSPTVNAMMRTPCSLTSGEGQGTKRSFAENWSFGQGRVDGRLLESRNDDELAGHAPRAVLGGRGQCDRRATRAAPARPRPGGRRRLRRPLLRVRGLGELLARGRA